MSIDNGDDDPDNVAGPSTTSSVEALSTGRSRRSNAGNRMRELLEQERERIIAEGEEPSLSSSRKVEEEKQKESSNSNKKSSKKGDEDENSIFQNEDNDIDFEEREGDGEDIIDSDFDLSSDQGDEDDEEAGEKELIAQEKAAKKVSRQKAKGIPMQIKRVAMPPKSALAVDEEEEGGEDRAKRPARTTKRISFAISSDEKTGTPSRQIQRSSKRKSTMKFSQTVQARLEEEEERRARQIENSQPKRKKVRLSQADLIAEALEMEERNRESLKVFLEREEERRERDRKRGKKRMEGPFLRWRSVTIEYGGTQIAKKPLIEEVKNTSNGGLTEDPVFAARQAAIKEREARQAAEERAKAKQDKQDTGALVEQSTGNKDDIQEADGSKVEAVPDISNEEEKVNSLPQEGEVIQKNDAVEGTDVVMANADENQAQEENNQDVAKASVEEADKTLELVDKDSDTVNTITEKEARAFLSLHELPQSTHWSTIFSYILGDHVDWSRYTIVPARNRPLRPRLSVCPITGLPAKYRDPRSGIPFATTEAYANLTAVMQGKFRWSRKAGNTVEGDDDESKAASSSKNISKQTQQKPLPRYDPLDMGCFLDRIDEPGANNVRKRYLESLDPKVQSQPVSQPDYIPVNTLAPGDEQALVAAALALPAGSTRSGSRRANV